MHEIEQARALGAKGAAIHRMIRIALDVNDLGRSILGLIDEVVKRLAVRLSSGLLNLNPARTVMTYPGLAWGSRPVGEAVGARRAVPLHHRGAVVMNHQPPPLLPLIQVGGEHA